MRTSNEQESLSTEPFTVNERRTKIQFSSHKSGKVKRTVLDTLRGNDLPSKGKNRNS
jgi:hypothetical protein